MERPWFMLHCPPAATRIAYLSTPNGEDPLQIIPAQTPQTREEVAFTPPPVKNHMHTEIFSLLLQQTCMEDGGQHPSI